ncbi:MAG TPA: group I intron-associated PD-(D/E)XK endonuclease [Thermoleophilaceae bacterium]
MAPLKAKGDLAEVMIAADLIRRGYKVAIPYGEDWDFDLIVCRNEQLERVQCKYACSDGVVVTVRTRSQSLTNGRVRATKRYTAAMIEWLAVYDVTSNRCYYIPAAALGEGMNTMSLRLHPTRNNQRRFVRFASDYLAI